MPGIPSRFRVIRYVRPKLEGRDIDDSAITACSVSSTTTLRRKMVILLMACAALPGCVICPTHYRASAVVMSGTGNVLSESPKLSDVVSDALRPLGYQIFKTPANDVMPEGMIYYDPPRSGMFKPQTNIAVSLDTKTSKIFLFNNDSSAQTAFARKVQNAIADQVRLAYGISISFEPPPNPVYDCLGP
jgi:hypothetical protein